MASILGDESCQLPPAFRDRVRGVLLGLAAGDRIGGPIRMALQLANSLADENRFDRGEILQNYLVWWRAEGFDTGPTSEQVFRQIESGRLPAEAIAAVHSASGGMTAGCNPAHRSAPLAMAAFLADDELADCACAEAALTHYDPLAGEVAAAAVILCRALIRGMPWPLAIQTAAEGRASETATALRKAGVAPRFRDGYAPHVLHTAVHFVQTRPDLNAALTAAVAFAGPANYCPVLAGAIGGARWGAARIEGSDGIEKSLLPEVCRTADKLALTWLE